MLSIQSRDSLGGGGTELLEPPKRSRPRRRRRDRGHAGGSGTPPADDDGGGGGGWGGGDDDPPDRPGDSIRYSTSAIGLGLRLVASGTLFVIFAVAFLLLRQGDPVWPPAGLPGAPSGLWLSSALLLASSLALVAGAREVPRPGAPDPELQSDAAWRWLLVAFVLGVAFVAAQVFVWDDFVRERYTIASSSYSTGFFTLTALHAAHVLGGVLYLGYLLWRGRIDTGVWQRPFRLASFYWHFMGVVWVLVFALLWTTS